MLTSNEIFEDCCVFGVPEWIREIVLQNYFFYFIGGSCISLSQRTDTKEFEFICNEVQK